MAGRCCPAEYGKGSRYLSPPWIPCDKKSITMDFIKPLDVGRKLIVVSSIQEIQSERQVLVTGEICSDEGKLCRCAEKKLILFFTADVK